MEGESGQIAACDADAGIAATAVTGGPSPAGAETTAVPAPGTPHGASGPSSPGSPERIEDVLARGDAYVGTTVGVSMWPMLRDRRDTIVVEPVEHGTRLRRFDVPLYRRGGAYVLHRIVRVHAGSYDILGDNCLNVERGVADAQIIGVLRGFYRGERAVDMDGWRYRVYVRTWHALFPVRRALMRLRGAVAESPLGPALRRLLGRGGPR